MAKQLRTNFGHCCCWWRWCTCCCACCCWCCYCWYCCACRRSDYAVGNGVPIPVACSVLLASTTLVVRFLLVVASDLAFVVVNVAFFCASVQILVEQRRTCRYHLCSRSCLHSSCCAQCRRCCCCDGCCIDAVRNNIRVPSTTFCLIRLYFQIKNDKLSEISIDVTNKIWLW